MARLSPWPARIVLFQVPIDDGRTALTFASDQLVALVTTPAVLAASEDVVVTAEALSHRIRARYVRFDGVLGAAGHARLLRPPSRANPSSSRAASRPTSPATAVPVWSTSRASWPPTSSRLCARAFPSSARAWT